MKNLIEIAKGMILVGAVTILLYGSHALQSDREVKKQLSLGQRQPIKQEIYAIKDYSLGGAIARAGLIGAGAGILYFTRRRKEE